MCVIITGTKNRPSLAELRAAERQNPDGGGMAWIESGVVQFRKGITADQMHESLEALPANTRWVAHFRFATVGTPSAALCHPFPIEKDSSLDVESKSARVLFHNGTVTDWKARLADFTLDPKFATIVPGGEWSDSRAVAWLLALNESIRGLSFLPGKYVVLTRKGAKIFPANEEGWTEIDGILYSNTFWMRRVPAYENAEKPRWFSSDTVDYGYGPLVGSRRNGRGSGRSLVDEAQDLLDEDAEADALDLYRESKAKKAPKRKASKKKAPKKKAPKKKVSTRKARKGIKTLKQGGSSRGKKTS